jgi:Ca-activated chloride channel family protein
MQFAAPWALLALLIIPVLALWNYRSRGRGLTAVRFSQLKALPARRGAMRPLLAAALPWLRIAALFLLILALARPQSQAALEKQTSEGIDIMLTMDISGSMLAEDFEPKNRFTVAKETLARFAAQTENDRLGLVIFARQAFTQCPLTLDHEMVSELISEVKQGIIEDGTAIGMAIATAAHRLRESKAKSRVIILMTDGMNNSGKIDPITAAKAAAALGVKIYAIGVGKEGGAPIPISDGIFGKQYLRNPDGTLQLTKIDEDTLKKVAKLTGARYFRATDAQALAKIYREIRRMEKSPFEIKKRRPVIEEFARYLWPALVLLLLHMTIGATYARKAP